ncbi:TPA: hypothetical protein KQB18_004288, partial [Clostridioides difficile]|nr:hypothetical protein [Clostridioides difficile]
LGITKDTAEELSLDYDGEVKISDEQVIGTAKELFGDKRYSIKESLHNVIDEIKLTTTEPSKDDELIERLTKAFANDMTEPLVEAAKQSYGNDLKPAQQKKIERRIKADVDIAINRELGDFKIQRNLIERDRKAGLDAADTGEEADEVNRACDERLNQAREQLVENLKGSSDKLIQSAGETIVRETETAKKEAKKQGLENGIR